MWIVRFISGLHFLLYWKDKIKNILYAFTSYFFICSSWSAQFFSVFILYACKFLCFLGSTNGQPYSEYISFCYFKTSPSMEDFFILTGLQTHLQILWKETRQIFYCSDTRREIDAYFLIFSILSYTFFFRTNISEGTFYIRFWYLFLTSKWPTDSANIRKVT